MNATIQRIVSRACGLQDVPYLFAKLRQCFLLNRCIYRRRLMQGIKVRVKNDIVTPWAEKLFQQDCSRPVFLFNRLYKNRKKC